MADQETAEKSSARFRRRSVPALLLAGALLGIVLLSVRRVAPVSAESPSFQVRRWLTGSARMIPPGFVLAPPLLSRLVAFPAQPVVVQVRLATEPRTGAAPGALASREGIALIAAGSLRLRAAPERAAVLAEGFPGGWGEDPARRLGAALAVPIAAEAASRSFVELMQAGRSNGPQGLPGPARAALEALGLSVEEGSTLRFYPAPPSFPSSEARSETGQGRKVLLVGLDGADWDIIDPLIEQGRMPHLSRMIREGTRARLRTITPVLSPIIWTSIVTGVGPDRHGIVDFLATSQTTGAQIPVTSNMRRVKAIWNILSERGRSAGVIAWWASWPAEPVNGFIVSDRVAYQLFGFQSGAEGLRRRTFPETLGLLIQPLIAAPGAVPDADVLRFVGDEAVRSADYNDQAQRIRTNLAAARTYLGIGLDLFAAYDTDLKAIYFEGTDTIAHNFMRYRPPAMPGVTRAELAAYGDVVDRYYEYQDELLGRVLDLADERTIVVICSDHGFRTGANRPTTDPRIEMGGAADWHRKFGILVLNGPGVRRGASIEDASVLDVTPTILAAMGLPRAADMEGRALLEAFESPAPREVIASYETGEAGSGAGPIDSELDDEILAKLTALGYVGQEGGNALNNTGITLMDRGRLSEAAEAFRRAIQQEPRFTAARVNLGRAQMLMKDYDAALATLEAVLKADPTQAEVHNLLGNIRMDRGELAAAERHFLKCLELSPEDTNAHNSLGLLYDRMGQDERAIAEYRKVIAVDPDYAEGYNNIGLVHRKRGRPDEAIEWFERAIAADAEFPGSYNNMGLAFQDMGRLDEARRAFDRGLAGDPDNAVILNNLGTLELAEGRLEQARAAFEKAIESDPEYPSAYNNLGAVLALQDKPREAFERYLQAVEIDPQYTDARFNLARALLLEGRTGEGIEMLEKVLAIDPSYGKASLQLALAALQADDHDTAIRRALEASRAMPQSADPHNLLAEIYMRQGRRDDARRELEASLEIDAAQPRVKEALSRLAGPASGR